jgi:hypothetical protein
MLVAVLSFMVADELDAAPGNLADLFNQVVAILSAVPLPHHGIHALALGAGIPF